MAMQRRRLRQWWSQRTSTGKGVRIGFLGTIVAAIISASASCSQPSTSLVIPIPSTGPSVSPTTDTPIRAVIGSEKRDFFQDPQVVKVLHENGFIVQADYMGSREMATLATQSGGLSHYDIAFPSSEPAADAIRQAIPSATEIPMFGSPMAIATFRPIARLLQKLGIAERQPDGIWTFYVQNFLNLMAKPPLRWNEIPGNNTYPSPNQILLTTTDPSESNSADMLVAIVSNVLNGGLVTDPADVARYSHRIASLFIDQGYTGYSSQDPMDEYLSSDGIGLAPMVLIYEAQFIGTEITEPDRMRPDMILMYPYPTVESRHTLLILNPVARNSGEVQRFANLLKSDPELTRLEAEHGFRAPPFSQIMSEHRISPPPPDGPPDLTEVDLPRYEILEGFLNAIIKKYHTQA